MGINLSNYKSGLDRGAPLWKEAAWQAFRIVVFLQRWPLPSSFRASILRLFGARVGRGVVIRSGVNIAFPWRLTLGDHVWIGEEANILNLAHVTIHDHCCISQRAFVCTGSHDFRSVDFPLVAKPIEIGPRSWLCAQAFVGPGVVVGPDSMVAAGSVVSRDVPPNTLASGNPASYRPAPKFASEATIGAR